jgi:hypothetical protein
MQNAQLGGMPVEDAFKALDAEELALEWPVGVEALPLHDFDRAPLPGDRTRASHTSP